MSASRPPETVASSDNLADLTWETLGPHRYAISDDTMFLRTQGDIDDAAMTHLLSLLFELRIQFGAVLLLIDTSLGFGITVSARRAYAEWGRTHGFQPGSTAVVGASAATRAILTLITNAMRLVLSQPLPVRFFKSRSEALLWLHSERDHWRSTLARSH